MAIDRGREQAEPDTEELLEDLEQRVERLRVLYEQYFMGLQKVEPLTARKDVTRKLLDLQQKNLRNTALRYRFHSLNQKFNVYQTYWNRTLRSIEKGTYVRDIARASRDAARKGVEMPDEVLRAMPQRLREKILKEREALASKAQAAKGEAGGASAAAAPARDKDFDDTFDSLFDQLQGGPEKPVATAPAPAAAKPAAAKPAVPPPVPPATPAGTGRPPAPPAAATRPAAPPPTPSSAGLPPGVDDRAAKDLYKRYLQAKQLVGEATEHVKYEHLVATLAKQAPAIMKQHNARGVEFTVVVKDNKVILKATPKK